MKQHGTRTGRAVLLLSAGLVLLVGASDRALSATGNMAVSVSLPKTSFRPGEPMILAIEVKNTGGSVLRVLKPSVLHKTVSIELLRDGRRIPAQRKWDGPFSPSMVELTPSRALRCEQDITWLYPMTVPSGQYQVRVVYQLSSNKSIASNTLRMELKPLSEDEAQALEDYRRVMQAGEFRDVAELGMEFLKKHQESSFANLVRKETAFALAQMGRYRESIELYRRISDSGSAAPWLRQEARFKAAHVLFRKGDVREAIAEMELLDTPTAKDFVAEWRSLVGRKALPKIPRTDTDSSTSKRLPEERTVLRKGQWTGSLADAAKTGNVEIVREMLATDRGSTHKADVQGDRYLLHIAAGRGHKQLAEFLLDKGYDVNSKDQNGLTPLHMAAIEGEKEIAELLIANGADVNARDEDGLMPLFFAKITGHKEVANLLSAHAIPDVPGTETESLQEKRPSKAKAVLSEPVLQLPRKSGIASELKEERPNATGGRLWLLWTLGPAGAAALGTAGMWHLLRRKKSGGHDPE